MRTRIPANSSRPTCHAGCSTGAAGSVRTIVTAFHPRIVGLTGSPAAIETVKKEFAIFSAKGDAAPGGGYLVNHSRQAYLMDPDGKPLALLPQDKGPQALADDIKRWAR